MIPVSLFNEGFLQRLNRTVNGVYVCSKRPIIPVFFFLHSVSLSLLPEPSVTTGKKGCFDDSVKQRIPCHWNVKEAVRKLITLLCNGVGRKPTHTHTHTHAMELTGSNLVSLVALFKSTCHQRVPRPGRQRSEELRNPFGYGHYVLGLWNDSPKCEKWLAVFGAQFPTLIYGKLRVVFSFAATGTVAPPGTFDYYGTGISLMLFVLWANMMGSCASAQCTPAFRRKMIGRKRGTPVAWFAIYCNIYYINVTVLARCDYFTWSVM